MWKPALPRKSGGGFWKHRRAPLRSGACPTRTTSEPWVQRLINQRWASPPRSRTIWISPRLVRHPPRSGWLDELGRLKRRRRGVIFDVGHGSGSVTWGQAVPMTKAGFNSGFHLNRSAHQQRERGNEGHAQPDGRVSGDGDAGRIGDRARDVESSQGDQTRETGQSVAGQSGGCRGDAVGARKFGFIDMYGARLDGTQKFVCELTIRAGKVAYDLNGLTRQTWDKLPPHYKSQGDSRWDGYAACSHQRSTEDTMRNAISFTRLLFICLFLDLALHLAAVSQEPSATPPGW
jgi:hypothetical protein